MSGAASHWFQTYRLTPGFQNWTRFGAAVVTEFEIDTHRAKTMELLNLKQVGTVDDYHCSFEQSHRRHVSLYLFSLTPRPVPPGPASPRSRPSVVLTPSPASPTPAALPCSGGNGTARARRSGAVVDRLELPTATPAPPPLLLLLPPHGRTHANPPPLFLSALHHRAAFHKRRPPPHCPPFRALRPSSSTVTLPARAARSRGPSRAPDATPLRLFGSHHCRHLGLTVSSASPSFSTQISAAPHFPYIY
jgi:hypothetical protein